MRTFWNIRCLLAITMMIGNFAVVFAQKDSATPDYARPVVGRPMPDFSLIVGSDSSKKEVSLKSFSGRWLFMTFWFPGCTNCIRALPELSNYQKEFEGKADFVLVGFNNRLYKTIEATYKKLEKKYDLHLTATFDSVLNDQWDIWSMPHIIIVDPQGIVRFITTGYDMNNQKIREMMEGKPVNYFPLDRPKPQYDVSRFPGSEAGSIVYRSILTSWRGERSMGSGLNDFVKSTPAFRNLGIQLVGYPLSMLYMFAYTGSDSYKAREWNGELVYPFPILEVSNDSLFRFDSTYTEFRGVYNYNLVLPESQSNNASKVTKAFQQELKNIFGYNVRTERRTVRVWRMKSDPTSIRKLKTQGGQEVKEITPVHAKLRNVPMDTFCSFIISQVAGGRIFVNRNETGYAGNIDITIDAVFTDMSDVGEKLKKFGFYFVEEDVTMNAIIISDAQ